MTRRNWRKERSILWFINKVSSASDVVRASIKRDDTGNLKGEGLDGSLVGIPFEADYVDCV